MATDRPASRGAHSSSPVHFIGMKISVSISQGPFAVVRFHNAKYGPIHWFVTPFPCQR
jgi:hypothetical protein